MLNELLELAKQQPILIGGMGTVFTSAALYTLRSIPTRIAYGISNSLTSTLSVNSRNDYFNHIDHYVWRYRIPFLFKSYEPSDRFDDELDNSEKVYLNPGYGNGWGYWKGVFFSFNKSKEEKGYDLTKSLSIRFWTRDVNKISKFVTEAYKFQRGEPRQRVYVSAGRYWNRVADKRLRHRDTVFVSELIIEKLFNSVNKFLDNEDWYIQRGIPYKMVILLYGPPGTGKTSLIHVLASHFNLDINYVTALGSLSSLIGAKNSRPAITVIEDIDTLATVKRDDDDDNDDFLEIITQSPLPEIEDITEQKNKKSNSETPITEVAQQALHDLLNSLDGFLSAHKSLVIITSNHPEKLDHALLRPGRIDLSLEIGLLDTVSAGKMFTTYYGPLSKPLWDSFASYYKPRTGASMQGVLMACHSADAAIKRLQDENNI